jgi:hypothetical protein
MNLWPALKMLKSVFSGLFLVSAEICWTVGQNQSGLSMRQGGTANRPLCIVHCPALGVTKNPKIFLPLSGFFEF